MLTADMPTFIINGWETSAAVRSHLPLSSGSTLTVWENSAEKNTFWFFAQPVE